MFTKKWYFVLSTVLTLTFSNINPTSKEQRAYEKLMKKRGFTIKKSPKTSKTDKYIQSPENIFETEIIPHLKTSMYHKEKNPDGIFTENNKLYWKTDWSTQWEKHWRIARRANQFITELIKKIVKHKKNTRYNNYLKSDLFKIQSWSDDIFAKIDNLITFYNLRLNEYKALEAPLATVDRLKIYIKNRREELISMSKKYFKYTPYEFIKLEKAE